MRTVKVAIWVIGARVVGGGVVLVEGVGDWMRVGMTSSIARDGWDVAVDTDVIMDVVVRN